MPEPAPSTAVQSPATLPPANGLPLTMSSEPTGNVTPQPAEVPAPPVPSATVDTPLSAEVSATTAETGAAANGELAARLADMVQLQHELKALFESRIHSDEVQGKSVERLSDELRDYKANFIRQQMLPLLKELIFCYDFATGEAQRLRNPEPTGNADPLRSLDMLGQMLIDVLFKYDVEPYRCAGEQFDPKEQQCSRTVPTDIDTEDKKIAGTGATGFRSPTGIIRREQVTVYKFRPAAK